MLNWGYLEAFDTNSSTRSFIGLSEELEWDEFDEDSIHVLVLLLALEL